ncbi:MAG: metallophosphoesterase family protein [Rhodobacterales bacterium]
MGLAAGYIKGWNVMRVCDLGEISGDMLLFGGVYSNLAALNALIEVAKDNGIAAQNCICTGDLVAYCADAEASVNAIRSFGCPVVAGNCELQLARDAQDCGCGFDAGSACSVLAVGWYTHARRQISDTNKRWMGRLPERILFTRNGQRYVVLHGGATEISRFIWPVTDNSVILHEIKVLDVQVGAFDHVISGHSGIAMNRAIKGISWTNTGAIGMPGHNGKQQTRYGYLSDKSIKIKELQYDVDATYLAMQRAGLTQGYDKTLLSGYWPSEDTLPPEMHQKIA